MSNLFGIGLSGLSAAQAGLNTASNNISNVNTPGYTRRSAQFSELTDDNGQGSGVNVTGVQRQYATFLSGQLNAAQSQSSATTAQLNQLSQIDSQLGDGTTGLGPSMQQFFDSLSGLAASPTDPSARSAVLGDASDLASQFNSFANQLSGMRTSVGKQLDSAVTEVNNDASQIAKLNEKIRDTQASTGQPPNQLLDERDQLVANTQKLVNVDVTKNDDGSYNLTVGGHELVGPDGSHQLAMTHDAVDPNVSRLGYVDANGNTETIADSRVKGGTIGGLLSFAHGSLTSIQNQYNQTAHTLAATVNAQHRKGRDLNGDPGTDLFTESEPTVYAGQNNKGSAALSAEFAPGETQNVTADNYQITYSAAKGYEVTRASDGSAVKASLSTDGKTLSFGGMDVQISGKPADGDRFAVHPLDGAAASISVAIKDPAKLAAAGANGDKGDNANASALAALQKSQSVEGDRSFSDNYAQLVGDVGNQAQSLKVDSDTQSSIVNNLSQAQQSVAGVNLDEENVNLMYYQRMYQANAKVIQTASSLFNSILSIAN